MIHGLVVEEEIGEAEAETVRPMILVRLDRTTGDLEAVMGSVVNGDVGGLAKVRVEGKVAPALFHGTWCALLPRPSYNHHLMPSHLPH